MKRGAVAQPVVIMAAVEGIVDEAVAQRLIEQIGAVAGPVYGRRGKDHLRKSLGGYNHAARFAPWLVLMDLNSDAECAPILRAALLPAEASMMRLRIAVREVEAWLLADRERFARFLGVPALGLPVSPEAEADPKRTVVAIARRSRRRELREDIVPRPGSGRSEGPGYASRIIEFVLDEKRGWRPEVAALRADSLRRCLAALKTFRG
jgi:hypothetical protein